MHTTVTVQPFYPVDKKVKWIKRINADDVQVSRSEHDSAFSSSPLTQRKRLVRMKQVFQVKTFCLNMKPVSIPRDNDPKCQIFQIFVSCEKAFQSRRIQGAVSFTLQSPGSEVSPWLTYMHCIIYLYSTTFLYRVRLVYTFHLQLKWPHVLCL